MCNIFNFVFMCKYFAVSLPACLCGKARGKKKDSAIWKFPVCRPAERWENLGRLNRLNSVTLCLLSLCKACTAPLSRGYSMCFDGENGDVCA